MIAKNCIICKKKFLSRRSVSKFCSRRCHGISQRSHPLQCRTCRQIKTVNDFSPHRLIPRRKSANWIGCIGSHFNGDRQCKVCVTEYNKKNAKKRKKYKKNYYKSPETHKKALHAKRLYHA